MQLAPSSFSFVPVLLMAMGCRRTAAQPPRVPHDAGAVSRTVSTMSLPYESIIAALPDRPVLRSESLVNEGRGDYPPGAPPGCTIIGNVRSVIVPGGAPCAFVTGVTPVRALLSIATSRANPTGERDAAAEIPADSATWIVDTAAPLAPPRWYRGPVAPGSTSAVAGATADTFVVAWSLAGPTERSDGYIRAAQFSGLEAPRVHTVAAQLEPAVSDLACTALECSLAYGWADRYALSDADRAAWLSIRPPGEPQMADQIIAPDGYRASNALASGDGGFIGTASLAGHLALFERGGSHATHRLDAIVLDVARIGSTLRAVIARAATTARCQPGGWHVELATINDDGSLGQTTELAVTDARPRGARVRALGPGREPLVTWLDAPQCAERFFVVRAWRNGEVTALAGAEEYDVATDGMDHVSLAMRSNDRIRWLQARCSP